MVKICAVESDRWKNGRATMNCNNFRFQAIILLGRLVSSSQQTCQCRACISVHSGSIWKQYARFQSFESIRRFHDRRVTRLLKVQTRFTVPWRSAAISRNSEREMWTYMSICRPPSIANFAIATASGPGNELNQLLLNQCTNCSNTHH